MLKRFFFFLTTLSVFCAGLPLLVSCSSDDDTPKEEEHFAEYHSSTCSFTTTASADLLKMAEMSMEVQTPSGTKTFALKSLGRVKFKETTTALPVAYEVTLRLARKPDFTPETGKSYNLKATFEYAINLEGKDGKPFDGVSDVSSSTDIIHMEGLDAAYIDQFFDEYLLGGDKVFPMTLSFKVYREGNHYVIKHPMER